MKFFLVLLLLIVLIAGGAAAWMWYGITKPYQGFAAEGIFVDVPRGASSSRCTSARNHGCKSGGDIAANHICQSSFQ